MRNIFYRKIRQLQNFIGLTVLYFFGIGITALLGKLLRKKFLDHDTDRSTWHLCEKKFDPTKMY